MQMEVVVMVYFEANVVYFTGSLINDILIMLHSSMGYTFTWSPTSTQPSKLSIYRLQLYELVSLEYYYVVYSAPIKLGCEDKFCPVLRGIFTAHIYILWQDQLMTLMHQFYGAVLLQDDISMMTAAMVTGEEDHTPSILVRLHYTIQCC